MRVREVAPEQIKKLSATFDTICQQVGRNPAEVEKAISLRAEQLNGSTEELRRQIQGLVDVGIRHFTISLAPSEQKLLNRFAKEVMPAFRET